MKRYGLAAAFALLVLVNAVVLAGVRYNRSGEAAAAVELTERELPLAWSGREDSGIALQLNWQRDGETGADWFDRRKLTEVGFDCRTSPDDPEARLRYAKALPRKTFLVLEFEGQAWLAWLERQRNRLKALDSDIVSGKATRKELALAVKRFTWDQATASRLLPVDAGNDPSLLRRRYPDTRRFLITPALVKLRFQPSLHEKGKPARPASVTGWIDEVLTDTIQVPPDRRGPLPKVKSGGKPWNSFCFDGEREERPPAPRYTVVLTYGKRHEPWVVSVRAGESKER